MNTTARPTTARPTAGIDPADVVMLPAIPVTEQTIYVGDQPTSDDTFYDVLDAMPTNVRRLRMVHAGSRLVLGEVHIAALVDAGLAVAEGDDYRLDGGMALVAHRPAVDNSPWLVSTDAPASTVQTVAAEVLGHTPGVTQGVETTVALHGRAAAARLVDALIAAGHAARASRGWGA